MHVYKFIISMIVSLAAGAIGSLATIPNITTWYAALDKPWLNPPNWVFGPVWTTLYVLMGISLYLVWTSSAKANKRNAYLFFAAQLMLNALWSLTFFGLHMPWLGVVIIVLLLLAISGTIRTFWKFSHAASWLLVPYIGWVSFATYLTVAIAIING
jgi:translocator protein